MPRGKKKVSWLAVKKNQYVLLALIVIFLLLLSLVSTNQFSSADFDKWIASDEDKSTDENELDETGTGVVAGSGIGSDGIVIPGIGEADEETDAEVAGGEDLGPPLGSACDDSDFPIFGSFEKTEDYTFCYEGVQYKFRATWLDTYSFGEMALSLYYDLGEDAGVAIIQLIHEYDSNSVLKYGNVRMYDVDEDDDPDFYFKTLPYDRDTGGPIYDVDNNLMNILIDTNPLEICRNTVDDDADGLTDCADPECNLARGLTSTRCNYPSEFDCEDEWNNDAEGGVDCNDPDCATNPTCFCSSDDDCEAGETCVDGDCVQCVDNTECNERQTCEDGYCNEYAALNQCNDGIDNDEDGLKDWYDLDCKNENCTAGLYITWSFMPEDTDFEIAPDRVGCCGGQECVNIGGDCIDYNSEYTTTSGHKYYICGGTNNWDRCGAAGYDYINKYDGDMSDGRALTCNKTLSGYLWLTA